MKPPRPPMGKFPHRRPAPDTGAPFSEMLFWSQERQAEYHRRVSALQQLGHPLPAAREVAFEQLRMFGRPRGRP